MEWKEFGVIWKNEKIKNDMIFQKKYVVIKGGRLKIPLFNFAIFDLNLAILVFPLFEGCV